MAGRAWKRLYLTVFFWMTAAALSYGQFYYNESFTTTSAPGWDLRIDGSGTTPGPRLTAQTTPTPTKDPETGLAIDAAGSGWMRLATLTGNQSNAIALDTPIPSSGNTIKIGFDYTMWGGGANDADGITVFLWDASVTFDPGAFGGSLGYANRTAVNGLAGGYLGVGLDVFGNYSNDQEGRRGAYPAGGDLDNALNKNQIVVRGPDDSAGKDGTGNYYYLAGTGGNNYTQAGNPAITGLNPATQNMSFGTYTARPDQDAVDFRRFELEMTPTTLYVRAQFGYTGALTTLYSVDLTNSYFTSRRPESLRIGFAASTGGSINVHEIRNLSIFASGNLVPGRSNYWDDQNGNNLWDTAVNWENDTVPVTYDFVVFSDQYANTAAPNPQTVTINGTDKTQSTYTFTGATSYTLTPQGTQKLIFESNTSNRAFLNVLNSPYGNADHTINADLQANDNLTIQNLVAKTLTLNGNINGQTFPIVFGTAGTTAVNGVLSGSGAITTKEDGTTIFAGANTYTNTTTVQNGILRATDQSALGTFTAGTTVQNGGTLQLANNITITGEQITMGGIGEGGIGALNNLSGANTWDGTAALTMTGNTTISSTAGSLNIGGSGSFSAVDYDLTVDTAANSSIAISRNITDDTGDATDLIKNGAGTLTLSGDNSYGGAVTVNAGVLSIASLTGLGTDNSSTTVNAGATLQFTGGLTDLSGTETFTITGGGVAGKAAMWSESGTNDFNGPVTITGGSATFGAASGATLRIDGGIAGTAQDAIIQAAAGGVVEFASGNSYTGNTFVNSGTMRYADGNNRVDDASNFTVASGATWDANNLSDTIGSLQGAGNVSLGSGADADTITSGGTNLSTVYSGVMSGSSTKAFTKVGTGDMAFTGANTLQGTLNVNAGSVTLGAANAFDNAMDLNLGGGTFKLVGFADTLDVLTTTAASTVDFTGTSGGLLTFNGNIGASVAGFSMTNWIGTPLTTSAPSTTTGLFVPSTSITANMATLATNTTFTGWGTGADWKPINGGTDGYELVPNLTGIYRWDRNNNDWVNTTGTPWVGNIAPPNATAGTGVYFGDDEDPQAGVDNTAAAHLVSLTGARTVGTMILDSTGGRDYSFRTTGGNQTLTFNTNAAGVGTAFLTVGGTESHVIGSTNANNQRLSVALADNFLIQNNSSAADGLTFGTAGGAHTFDTNGYAVTVSGSSRTVINSQITDTGSIVKNGSGALLLNDDNTYSGGTTMSDGTLQFGNATAAGSGTLTVNGGILQSWNAAQTLANTYAVRGGFTVNDATGDTGSNNLTLSGPGTVAGVNTVTVDTVTFTLGALAGANDLTGTGGLTKQGNGTLTFAGDNSTFSGGLIVNAGTVNVPANTTDVTIGGVAANENFLGAGNVTVNTGGTLNLPLNAAAINNLTINQAGTLTNTGGTITSSSTNTGSNFNINGGLVQSGGTSTFTVGGDVLLGNTANADNGTITATGGTLTFTAGDDFLTQGVLGDTVSMSVSNGATVSINLNGGANSQFSLAGVIDTVTPANTWRDTLTISGSTTNVTVTGTAGSDTTGSDIDLLGRLNLYNNSTLTVTGETLIGNSAIFDGGTAATAGTLVVRNSDLTINEPLVSNRPNVTLDTSVANSITAPDAGSSITNLGTLTKSGAGTTTINSNVNNIEAVSVNITGGTLLLGASDQLANSNNLILAGSGVTFGTSGNDEIVKSLTVSENSTIDMGGALPANKSILQFTDSGSNPTAKTLTISSWNGIPGYGQGTDQIIFGVAPDATFLANVFWADYGIYGAILVPGSVPGTVEIVPVPEPATIAAGLGLLGLIYWDWRRRRANRTTAAANS